MQGVERLHGTGPNDRTKSDVQRQLQHGTLVHDSHVSSSDMRVCATKHHSEIRSRRSALIADDVPAPTLIPDRRCYIEHTMMNVLTLVPA